MDFHCKFKLAENTSIEALQSFFMEHMNDYESDDEENEYYLPREGSKPINYAETKCGRWLADPKMNDPHSKLSKLFLLRFCVPYMRLSTSLCLVASSWKFLKWSIKERQDVQSR